MCVFCLSLRSFMYDGTVFSLLNISGFILCHTQTLRALIVLLLSILGRDMILGSVLIVLCPPLTMN